MSSVYAFAVICAIALFIKVVLWIRRIREHRRYMSVIPVLVAPTNLLRNLWPRKWQKFHNDWCLHYGREVYREYGSDILCFVSFLYHDQIWVADPASFVEIKVTNTKQYAKDLEALKPVTKTTFSNFELKADWE